jgi:hypothetical protein
MGGCAMFAAFSRLAGHSMGAESLMPETGARNMIDVPSPPAGQDRFDAYVAFVRHCGIDTGFAGEHYRNSVAEDGRAMADASRRHT